jgi:hypothetical protein
MARIIPEVAPAEIACGNIFFTKIATFVPLL